MARYTTNGLPWGHGLGKDVTDCNTAQEVMRKAGLDWVVKKCELVAKMPFTIGGDNTINEIDELNGAFARDGKIYRTLPEAYGTYRTDKNIPLGLVKSKYEVVQNMDAFNFFDDAIGIDKCKWESAGALGHGHKIFVTAKLDLTTEVKVGGIKDPIENYLVFTNSHDGSTGVKILFTPIRVVCQNTLNAAIKTSTNFVSFRHTSSVHDNINVAKEILGICKEKVQFVKEQFNFLANKHISDENAMKLFGDVILTDKEKSDIIATGHNIQQIITRNYDAIYDANISMKKVNTLSEMNNYYYVGAGQREVLGTAWGVLNAVSGYYSNVDNAEKTKRMDTLLYGDRSNKIANATNLLMAA